MPVKILACDDNLDVLVAVRLLLRGAGYDVVTVSDPAQARAAVEQATFDLILTDMNYTRDTTSGEEGLALIAALRNTPGQAPVVAMTAWGDVELAVRSMQAGAVDFITKPFENARLLEKVALHIGKQKLEEQARALARDVQRRLLPGTLPNLTGLEVEVKFQPALEVGGDYYDFFPLDHGRLAFVLADVSGKGVPAALLMSNLQALFRSGDHAKPAQLLSQINRLFHAASTTTMYVTLFYGVIDIAAQRLQYANCGHPSPLLDQVELKSNNTVIGLFPELDVALSETDLTGRRELFVFSDGYTDEGDDCTELRFRFR